MIVTVLFNIMFLIFLVFKYTPILQKGLPSQGKNKNSICHGFGFCLANFLKHVFFFLMLTHRNVVTWYLHFVTMLFLRVRVICLIIACCLVSVLCVRNMYCYSWFASVSSIIHTAHLVYVIGLYS
jgi:hypothetical protein